MKKLIGINLLLVVTLILGSCGSSNNVVSNKLITKRKYNKGFFVNKKAANMASSKNKVEETKNETTALESITAKLDLKEIKGKLESNRIVATSEAVGAVSNETEGTLNQTYTLPNVDNDPINESEIPSEKELEVELESQVDKNVEHNKGNEKENKNNGSSEDTMFILAVILAILIPPLGVLVYTNIDWMKVLIALVLTLLLWLPGMIYALLVVFDVI